MRVAPGRGMRITDKMRLDWLQKNRAILDASCYRYLVSPAVVIKADNGIGYGQTIREAIDKAMAR